ncbi:methyltransferase domain-containing protein [Burkholderia guangdongensis]|uniref:methyltransferase domain-containing protein n=1 Tax=Burkholderia guangdongensis TaxID=1792500 RepID=UPI0015C7DB0D|nr:methyltransferase domain-containing protein [Burkholderia guangdongensis]
MSKPVLEDLIARVKAEAAAYGDPLDAPAAATPSSDERRAALRPIARDADKLVDDVGKLANDRGIEYPFLLRDDAFVDGAYRLLLGRVPDDSGREHYEQQLAQGLTRLELATALRYSDEGRRTAAPLLGMRSGRLRSLALHLMRRVGLGSIGERAMHRANERFVRRLIAHSAAAWRERFERTLDAVQRTVNVAQRTVDALHRHEQLISELHHALLTGRHTQTAKLAVPQDALDAYYLAFEDANRGTREEISAKLGIYDGWLAALAGNDATRALPVVDIGCGRGEWLAHVKAAGLRAVGIDVNRPMVDTCLAQGFDARCTDALTYLRSLPTGSVAAVTGFHIVEHLPFDYLFALVQESFRVVAIGGAVLFETPNPENVLVGSHTFYHDFTHRNPVTPTALSFLLRYHGFDAIDIVRSSPYPEDAKVPGDDPLTARVNGHLCGPQDFAAIARKPADMKNAENAA